jgi:ATP-dependent RNA helicase DDX5/DBP2
VKDIKFVINYDFPGTIEDYVHRIGRTGRASATGTAITFFTQDNAKSARALVEILREAGQEVPPALVEMVGRPGGSGGGRGFGGRGRYSSGSRGGGGNRGGYNFAAPPPSGSYPSVNGFGMTMPFARPPL